MIRSFVMRGGRATTSQNAAYNELSPIFCLPVNDSPKPLDFSTIFGNRHSVVCEIGFGMGGATAALAKENPSLNYIGIEVFKAGIGKLLLQIKKQDLKNIRIIEYDAALVFENMIADNSLDAIHIFFPDPWQKKRHQKRRLVRRPFTDTLAQKLTSKGYIYIVTDWEDYANFALSELEATPALRNEFCGESSLGFALPLLWRPTTEFERKAIAKNHKIFEIKFAKNMTQP